MKFSSSKQILQNPFILYFVLAIALGDLLYLSVASNYAFIAIFMLIGFLASFFSKNMVVILVIAMATTSIIQLGVRGSINEGMEGEDDNEKDKEEGMEDKDEGMEGEDKEKEDESFTDKPEEPKKENVTEDAIDKMVKKQEVLADKVDKLDPLLKKVENFVARMEKFSEYASSV